MTISSRSTLSVSTTAKLSLWINRGLESLWLLAVFLIPLAFLNQDYAISEASIGYVEVPKIALLRTLVALMAVLWLIEWGIRGRSPFEGPLGGQSSWFRPREWFTRLRDWLREQPTRWLLLAVWFFLCTTLLSTVLSGSFNVSLWGEVPGQDGYPAYTVVAYVLLFAVIATHLKTRGQLWRLIGAIVAMGTLVAGYAILQHYGHDFLDLLEQTGGGASEVSVFMGNSLFAGATLMMVIPLTLVAAVLSLGHMQWGPRRSWPRLAPFIPSLALALLWSAILTAQLLGIYFTFARGPWVGITIALAGFLGLVAIFAGWRALGRAAAILAFTVALLHGLDIIPLLGFGIWLSPIIGLAGALILALVYMDQRVLGPVILGVGFAVILALVIIRGSDLVTGPDTSASAPATQAAPGELAEQLSSIRAEVLGGFASGRATHWKVSWRLFRDHPWFEFDSLSLPWLRHLIGYGPDLFRYTYLLESPPEGSDLLPQEPDHAHNFFIHHAVVQGIFGLFSSLGIFAAVFVVGGYLLIRDLLLRRGQGYSLLHKLILIGLLATLAGRFLEMMVGVARVSDLTVLWVLLAVFAALPQVMQASEAVPESVTSQPIGRRTQRRAERSPSQTRQFNWGFVVRLAIVVWLIGGIFVLTWVKSVNSVRAAVNVGEAVRNVQRGNFQAGLADLDQAINLAPDVTVYYNYKALVYLAYQRRDDLIPEQECATGANQGYLECLAFRRYLINLQGTEKRPFYYRSHFALANSAFTLGTAGATITLPDAEAGNDKIIVLADEAVRLYEETLALVPSSWIIQNDLADAYLATGQPEATLRASQESLAITEGTSISSRALMLQGLAYRELGEVQKSVQSLEQHRQVDPGTAARNGTDGILGELYSILGQLEMAADAWLRQGIAYQEELGRVEESTQVFKQSADAYERLGRREPAAEALFRLGLAYLILNQLDNSAQAFERNLELVDQGPSARNSHRVLAEVYASLGKSELAATHRALAEP